MNLKKKRNRHIEEEEEEIDPLEVYKILNNTETQYKNEITIDKKLDAIKEIIESFYICFNKALKKEFILDALKMNSMNKVGYNPTTCVINMTTFLTMVNLENII